MLFMMFLLICLLHAILRIYLSKLDMVIVADISDIMDLETYLIACTLVQSRYTLETFNI